MRHLAISSFIAVCAWSSAHATPAIDLGDLGDASAHLGQTHGSKAAPFNGVFTDTYAFTLSEAGEIKGGLHTTRDLPFGISFLSIMIDGGGLLDPLYFDVPLDQSYLDFGYKPLQAGAYTLTVSGEVFGGKGSYGGDISGISAPVPEPEAWALVGAGLFSVAAFKRRRPTRG